MKKFTTLFFLLVSTLVFAQDVTGTWYGLFSYPGGKMRLTLHITKTATGYAATFDSPDEKAAGLPIPSIAFENNTLAFAAPAANLDYKGTLENNAINGNLLVNNTQMPLDFGREEIKAPKVLRPQEPVKPYPYVTEDVTFKNEKAGVTLAGTLTLPKKEGNFPAVILITGSGAQNRDEEIMGHKPFLVLADFLTKNGIAVLRYDDRGVGKSTGDFETATTQDFATDADAAFQYLKTRKEINKNKIGLAGHSEGGAIAPIVAVKNPDAAFIVLMAGPAIAGDEVMMLQNYMLGKADGMPEEELTKLGGINRKVYDIIKQESNTNEMQTKMHALLNAELKPLFVSKGIPQSNIDQYINMQISGLISPWYVNFMKYDPAPTLEKVKCPILAINGDKDLQVAAMANLNAIKRIAEKSGNKKVITKQLPGLNHLFQESDKGLPSEYGTIEQTISPVALNEISGWILKQVK
jgi:pimeloyl-ACP methyl ester carboxylesterase